MGTKKTWKTHMNLHAGDTLENSSTEHYLVQSFFFKFAAKQSTFKRHLSTVCLIVHQPQIQLIQFGTEK